MIDLLAALAEQARAFSVLEVIAVVMAIAYLLLAIRQNILCWLCAGLSTAIYVYLFFAARLYMESVLNVFYFAMAIYGFVVWRGGRDHDEIPVSVWPLVVHASAIAAVTAIAALNGYLLDTMTDAAFPYVDSLTTWAAIWATFLVARKVLENWWYWLLIDGASVYIYYSRGLELTALLFIVYVVMIPFGLLAWRRSMYDQVQ